MYEEVCLICGRPVLQDGRAYCSDECENVDVTSPSISTTSSAHASPFLHSTNNPPSLAEVPALLPSALGTALDARKSHRVRHSESSSSTSSTSWYAIEDEYDEERVPSILYGTNTDDESYSMHTDYLHPDSASKLSPSFAALQRHAQSSSLAYVRRPSTTNHRSIIPTLHRRTSSVSTPSTASTGVSRSMPYDGATEDDMSDVPSVPPSSASIHSGRKVEDSSAASTEESEREKEQETLTGKKRRNRASLPAYFSLLVSTSTTPRSHKGASALSMLSRSLQNSSSPPTPRLAKPVVDTTTAFAMAQSSHVSKVHTPPFADAAPRGRSRRRDPDGRSSSSRRSPSRSPRPRAHGHNHQSAQTRARLDSMEKVADWVAHSPVVAAGVRAARHLAERRNSSPPPLPKFERADLRDSGVDIDPGYLNSAVEETDDEEAVLPAQETRRGRRRVNELDHVPFGAKPIAPGFGNGRSGLLARERGRTSIIKR